MPRNPLVVPVAQRKAGAHGKSKAAQRRAEKMALQKLESDASNHGD